MADQNLPREWTVLLTDLETGATMDMLSDSYTFSVETQPAIDADERFLITFTPPPVSGEWRTPWECSRAHAAADGFRLPAESGSLHAFR